MKEELRIRREKPYSWIKIFNIIMASIFPIIIYKFNIKFLNFLADSIELENVKKNLKKYEKEEQWKNSDTKYKYLYTINKHAYKVKIYVIKTIHIN